MCESGIGNGARDLARQHHVAVLAGQPDRLAAGLVDVADKLLVDRAGEHHFDDLDGLLVGDAQAVGELGFDAEPVEHVADLRPAAVHDDRIDRGLLHQHDVAREAARRRLVAHGVAAVFHHDDLVVVALHVRQRLRQNAGDVERRDGHGGVLERFSTGVLAHDAAKVQGFCDDFLVPSSLPGLTLQSILLLDSEMDARVKPAHDELMSALRQQPRDGGAQLR